MSCKEVLTDARTIGYTFPSVTAIEPGDLLFNNSGVAAKASAQADQLTEAANQALFASLFIGVSADKRLAAETGTGERVIITDGIFDVTCPSTTFAVGDLVGPSEATSGTALENQQVEKVTDPTRAIGYCVKPGTSITTVRCRLISRYMPNTVERSGFVIPIAAQQTLAAGGGAVTITEFYTAGASDAGGDAWTLANGLYVGQLKKIQLITDGGGNAVLTPTSLSGGTTITFADAGDYALLAWSGTAWVPIELGNDADGATAPALA